MHRTRSPQPRAKMLLADPPWPYRSAGQNGAAAKQYDPMSVVDICSLPVQQAVADDAVLLLWTTGVHLVSGEAHRVAESWGFTAQDLLPWVKCQEIWPDANHDEPLFKPFYGIGYWFRSCVEYVLVATRGNAVFSWPHQGLVTNRARHSVKPDTLYEAAEAHPGPYVELFGRRSRPGWVTLGNEAPGDGRDIRDSLTALIERVRP